MRPVGQFPTNQLASIALAMILGAGIAFGQGAGAPATAAAPSSVAATAMQPSDIGFPITVHGQVMAVVAPSAPGQPIRVVLSESPRVAAVFATPVAAEIANAGRSPKVGEFIRVRGVVGEFKGELQVTIAAPDDMTVVDQASIPADAPRTAAERGTPVVAVASVADNLARRVSVEAELIEVKPPQNERAPTTLVVADDSGKVDIVYWEDVSDYIDPTLLTPGAPIVIEGQAQKYRERLQLRVDSPDAIKIDGKSVRLAGKLLPEETIVVPQVVAEGFDAVSSLQGKIDTEVKVHATVVSLRQPWSERAPATLTVADATGKVDVVFWRDTLAAINPQALATGTLLNVDGKVQMYRDRLQLRIEGPESLTIVAADGTTTSAMLTPEQMAAMPAPSPTPAATATTAAPPVIAAQPAADGSVPVASAAAMMGKPITIVGTVKEARDAWSETAPNIMTVNDESGTIDVVYWAVVKDKLPAGVVAPGNRLRISGVVNEHKGKTQIKVTDAARIELAK